MSIKQLEASIPANNEKIIEIYKKMKSGQLNPSPDFQRKLVWKRQHKVNFIQTILMNYPFPEIYKAPGELNVESLNLIDQIVDGQQRVTTIRDFIDGEDIFALQRTPIKFASLSEQEKADFLNYEVSVRYLKNATKEQIKEIFQRINNTEYSLNSMERLNAQWGDSEFVCYGKQIIEEDLALDKDLLTYVMGEEDRHKFLNFFHARNIFTENDNNRMLSLQYILTLMATILRNSYFSRNNGTQRYIELYNDEFEDANEFTENFIAVIAKIDQLNLHQTSYWFNKSNIFTLICEMHKYDLSSLNCEGFSAALNELESKYLEYSSNPEMELESNIKAYFEYAREAVNELSAREHRGRIISTLIQQNI